jgi:hypothetical protein
MKHGLIRGALITAAAITAAACSSGTPATPSSATTAADATTAPVSPTAAASTAQPETAAAATAVAKQYYGLDSAGQFGAAWGLLAPSAQRAVSRATWVAVHQGCPSQSAGITYDVSKATLTGDTAIIAVSLPGTASSLGSESEALTYSAGRWGFVPNDLSMYKHGSVRADVAAAKTSGYCAAS